MPNVFDGNGAQLYRLVPVEGPQPTLEAGRYVAADDGGTLMGVELLRPADSDALAADLRTAKPGRWSVYTAAFYRPKVTEEEASDG